MMLAAVHPYGDEEPLEISRTGFESIVRYGFYFAEDTLEDLPTEEVVEGVHRELDLMKSFPAHQPLPRAEVTVKVWSARWFPRRKGPKQVRARFVMRFATSLDANFYSPTPGFEVTRVGGISVAFMNTYVEPLEGLYGNNDTGGRPKRALNGLRERIPTLP